MYLMLEAFITQHPFVAAVLSIVPLGILFGGMLGYAKVRFKPSGNSLEDQINDILPQTQCGQCGYPGCRPYANAIANQNAPINRCPPGGESGIKALANLLGTEPLPLDAEHGEEKPLTIAYIREDECIGCTKCIQACPVDAIMGASKVMHTVISAECTGCDLCVEPCPVDCIEMRPVKNDIRNWSWSMPNIQLIATDRMSQPGINK